jgi:hypothetical protein
MVELLSPSSDNITPATAASGPAGVSADMPRLASANQFLRESPPWLFSAIIHLTAMIVLGLMIYQAQQKPDLVLAAGYVEPIDEEIHNDLSIAQPEIEVDSVTVTNEVFTPQDLPIVEDPLGTPEGLEALSDPLETAGTVVPTTIGIALTGREPGMKKRLLKTQGGTARTEHSVGLGLQWLARQQGQNGSWSLSGPYSNGSGEANPEGATAMALLAFQGAGYTPQDDPGQPFTPVVVGGWDWLLQQVDPEGQVCRTAQGNQKMYTQALGTIALCELYAMTEDSQYYDAAQRAVDYCLRAQSSGGGWRYNFGEQGDLSVTGWMVMAMQSARMAGFEVPDPAMEKAGQFLDTVAHQGGSLYSYIPQEKPTPAMTAEGLLCRQYLGWRRNDERLLSGVNYLLSNLPTWETKNVYHWYYATQVCHHMGGRVWRIWNKQMREVLPSGQLTAGPEEGSWDPQGDPYAQQGGRLYVTCLSLYMLEVYYRHLPLYKSIAIEQRR